MHQPKLYYRERETFLEKRNEDQGDDLGSQLFVLTLLLGRRSRKSLKTKLIQRKMYGRQRVNLLYCNREY